MFIGDFSNRFVYKHHDLTHLAVTKNGDQHYCNAVQRDMKLDHIQSKNVQFWYKKMLECFPPTARLITLNEFASTFFLFCVDLKPTPTHMYPGSEPRPLHLVTSGFINLELQFKNNLTENMVLYVVCHENVIVKIGATGLISEE